MWFPCFALTALEGSTYAWTGQDDLNRYITGQYRPLSVSQLIQEVMELELRRHLQISLYPSVVIQRLFQPWAVTCAAGTEAIRIYELTALLLISEQSVLWCPLMPNSAEQVGIMSGSIFFESRILPLSCVLTVCWLPTVTLSFWHQKGVPVIVLGAHLFQVASQHCGYSPGVAVLGTAGDGPLCHPGSVPSQISKLQYSSMARRSLVEIITLFIIFHIVTATQSWLNNRV